MVLVLLSKNCGGGRPGGGGGFGKVLQCKMFTVFKGLGVCDSAQPVTLSRFLTQKSTRCTNFTTAMGMLWLNIGVAALLIVCLSLVVYALFYVISS